MRSCISSSVNSWHLFTLQSIYANQMEYGWEKNTQIEYRFLLIAIEPHSMALCVVVWLSLTGNKVILFDINLQFPR